MFHQPLFNMRIFRELSLVEIEERLKDTPYVQEGVKIVNVIRRTLSSHMFQKKAQTEFCRTHSPDRMDIIFVILI